ncbi:MAG: methyl-accepting chemotaxis protein [Gammaproteobacteria bacterium]|nr:methyl-accepting chemotaxis protein [Gammaproteobacteria bacterium]
MKPTMQTTGFTSGGIMLILVVLLIGAAGGMVFMFFMGAQSDKNDKTYILNLGNQRVLSQELAKLASQAARGRVEVFPQLDTARKQFQEILDYQMKQSNPAIYKEMTALTELDAMWKTYRSNIDTILNRREVVQTMRNSVNNINDQIPTLLAQSDEVVDAMKEQGAPADQVYIATRQLMLVQRISGNVSRVLEGGEEAVTASDRFGRDAALFGSVIYSMLNGNQTQKIQRIKDPLARKKLEDVSAKFNQIKLQVGAIMEKSSEMFNVSGSAEDVLKSSGAILSKIEQVGRAYEGLISKRVQPTIAYLLAGLSLLLIVALGFIYLRDSKLQLSTTEAQRRTTEDTNRRNQEAILRLLDEMGDLADGDLTVQATVTEDITGAIADSINYAIDALRNLVQAINETTQQVSTAAQQSQATAIHLAEASDHQAQQITGASSAINEMAVSIEAVSRHAGELAEEANNSVDIAVKGTEAVRRTIRGMDGIREQIQETSKRIKRLGESSQEIGDIVELINDIAEQTNILALNAAIQAAMAGEAGRGFAVVADEVQRLAERSADATKQIEALVKGIQSDTKEAVASMEQSTSGVVQGAQLAQNAGTALEQIENVSKHLAELIRNISDSARQQASAANNISDTMNVIQEITTQTSAGTNETAASIGNLAELANELRRSVAGFKLPL